MSHDCSILPSLCAKSEAKKHHDILMIDKTKSGGRGGGAYHQAGTTHLFGFSSVRMDPAVVDQDSMIRYMQNPSRVSADAAMARSTEENKIKHSSARTTNTRPLGEHGEVFSIIKEAPKGAGGNLCLAAKTTTGDSIRSSSREPCRLV